MSISVIIPVYNRVNLVGRALESVFRQSLQAQEVIVIDDGSNDGTGDFVASHYPRAMLVRQTNRGLSAARNEGIARASGEFLAFLDSDDLWLPQKLEVQAKVFAERPNLGLLATQKYKNKMDYPIVPIDRPRLRYYSWGAFLQRTRLHPSSVMIPRRVLEAVGGFDERLRAAEDWDMWSRIACRYPVARIEQPLTAVHVVEDSMSRNRLKQYLSDIEIIAKWDPANPHRYKAQSGMSRSAYQRHVLIFSLLRGKRLWRFSGREAVGEFLDRLEERIALAGTTRSILRAALRLSGQG